jgi:sugar O-acyltransferase (sialic acid O-acetyltransferase NeuD family)
MNLRSIAIFGGPGGGAIVAQSVGALAASMKVIGFLNDRLPRGELVSGVPVIGPFESWVDLPEEVGFLAPLHQAGTMEERRRIVAGLIIPEHRWATVIDPRSAVAPDAHIGHGCFVGPFATVGPAARLGAHCIIRAGAHVSHDCVLGDFVFAGANAVVCGRGVADTGAYIAPNATIRDHCRVGRFAVVGLGAVVTKDIPDFMIVAGSPARPLSSKERDSEIMEG